MNQSKIGSFIKELRKEKGLTQEQLAEQFGVSRRSVSRWETGNNLPDLDILVEMSDYFKVNLRELLDGERDGVEMDRDLENTVRKVADYSNEENKKLTKRMHRLFIVGFFAAVIGMVLTITDHADNFAGGLCHGITFGMMIVGVVMTSSYAAKIRAFKLMILHKTKK